MTKYRKKVEKQKKARKAMFRDHGQKQLHPTVPVQMPSVAWAMGEGPRFGEGAPSWGGAGPSAWANGPP